MKLILGISFALLVWKASLIHAAVLQRIGNSSDFFLIEQVKINDSKLENKPNETIVVEFDLRRKSARQEEDGAIVSEGGLGAFNSIEGFLLSTLTGSIFAELVPGSVGNTIKRIYAPINNFVEPFVKNIMKNVNQANATKTQTTTANAEEEEDREERAIKIPTTLPTNFVD